MAKTGDLHLATSGDFFMAMGIGGFPETILTLRDLSPPS